MEYPYFIIPVIDAYREAKGQEKAALARRISAAVGDRMALRAILGMDPDDFASFYPEARSSRPSTSDTIDSFIDRFADPAMPRPSEVEEIVPSAVPYSIAELESEEELEEFSGNTDDDTSSLLDSFLSENPVGKNGASAQSKTPEPEEKTPRAPENLSESLARLMIKNGNYQKAIEIITEISLKNPKKSIYFADQIRFLKKLAANAGVSTE